MKISAIYLVLAVMLCSLLFTGCSKDDNQKYKVKGRLLKACDNPVPVAGMQLILHYDGGYSDAKDLATTTTDANGNFEFGYDGVSRILDITLSVNGESAAGLGSRKGYIGAIPRNKDIDVGDIYADRNFFAVVKIAPQRQTSANDTIYYNYWAQKYLKKIVGPFSNNQVLDTLIEFYPACYGGCLSPNFDISYQWKLGSKGKVQYSGAPFISCTQQEFILELK